MAREKPNRLPGSPLFMMTFAVSRLKAQIRLKSIRHSSDKTSQAEMWLDVFAGEKTRLSDSTPQPAAVLAAPLSLPVGSWGGLACPPDVCLANSANYSLS
ncbi:hypothetical protein SRHO_G00182140 [Serrasalmus rhombeus]